MSIAMGFSNARLQQLTPIINSTTFDDVEAQLQQLFIDMFNQYVAEDLFDINVIANPQLGSIELVRKSIDDMGLSLLNEIINDRQARLIHKIFRGQHYQGRGFFLFESILRVLYRTNYAIEQYWHPKVSALAYPANVFRESQEPDISGAFLTSRIYIRIPKAVAPEITVLRKLALSLLPARIVAFVEASPPVLMVLDAHDAAPPVPEVIINESNATPDYDNTFRLGGA